MAYKATPEVIISIKREIERRKLSVGEVEKQLAAAGHPIAESTIRRFLKPGSENSGKGFRYETTVRPLWDIYMTDTENASRNDLLTRVSDLEALVVMKDEAIADLRDRLASMEVAHGEKCKDCSSKKDKQLEEQRAEIVRLQSQVDRLLNIVLRQFENNT